jgi:hypothetical protein
MLCEIHIGKGRKVGGTCELSQDAVTEMSDNESSVEDIESDSDLEVK